MPSGKKARQQRQQAVAAPPPVGGAGARQASPKVLGIGGGVIALIIVAIVLAVVLSRNNSGVHTGPGSNDGTTVGLATGTPKTGSSTKSNALGGPALHAAEVATLLKGIPQNGLTLGNPNAPVTLVEYLDFQCPVCDEFETGQFGPLVDKYVRAGKLKIVMKPWNILDANDGTVDSLRGQKAVIAAAAQNKAFNFAQVLYDNQGTEGTNWMNDAAISNFAASVDGLDTERFATDANSSTTKQIISTVNGEGTQVSTVVAATGQSPGTPTLLLAKGNGKPKLYGVGLPSLGSLESAIEALLNK